MTILVSPDRTDVRRNGRAPFLTVTCNGCGIPCTDSFIGMGILVEKDAPSCPQCFDKEVDAMIRRNDR